uniref:Fibronectin type-II domain-containing protein n=1 Tax=Salvator merianae TaxID=96440 RepID=A0A8D0E5V7_SALMN
FFPLFILDHYMQDFILVNPHFPNDGVSFFPVLSCAGLDANPKGPCVFPFIYNLTSYSSCTTDGISNKKPWCSLTDNYDADLQWTYCEPSVTILDFCKFGPSCVFPFIYEGKLYRNCTTDGRNDGKFWCSTSRNYDSDKEWKLCPEDSEILLYYKYFPKQCYKVTTCNSLYLII